MRTLPPEPNPGDKISASLIRELIRAIRERTIIPGSGVNASFGPNGTVVSSNAIKGKSSGISEKGCFKILSVERDEEDEDSSTIKFGNPYYMIGGKTYWMSPEEGEEGPCLEVDLPCIVYLKIGAEGENETTIESCSLMTDLQNEQIDDGYYCIPLYEFDEDGALTCDFRNMPTAAMGEF